MKYSLLLIAVFLFVMWFGFYLMVVRKENKKKSHHGFCLHCPDTCVVRLTNGIDLRGVDVPYWKQTMECDCSGKTYFSRVGNTRAVEADDKELKSVRTDGVRLAPTGSKLLDKDTIYIYRDTCTLRGVATGSTMVLYADDSGNLTAPTDTIIYRKLKQQ